MSLLKVSVIIPNYNHGVYLKQRIETVLSQTYGNLEVIILDDGSTDNSREIIKEYSNHSLVKQVVFNDQNSGNPFKQWKRGIELALGDWIWIAESDDFADPTFLETMISIIAGLKNIGLAYCDSYIINNGNVENETFATIKSSQFKTDRWKKNYVNNGLNELENYLLLSSTINNTSAVLFNREVLLRVNPFDIPLRYIGDKYAFVKVLAESDIAYLSKALNYYRDPFNVKHADKTIFYFYEQFLIFDWVIKNLKQIDQKKYFEAFFRNTRNSIFRDWSQTKVTLYRKIFRMNPGLFLKCASHNLSMAVHSLFLRTKT